MLTSPKGQFSAYIHLLIYSGLSKKLEICDSFNMDRFLSIFSLICCSLALYKLSWTQLTVSQGIVITTCFFIIAKGLAQVIEYPIAFISEKRTQFKRKYLKKRNNDFIHAQLLQKNSKLAYQVEVLKAELEESSSTIKDMVKIWSPNPSSAHRSLKDDSPLNSIRDLEFIETPTESSPQAYAELQL